MAAQPYWRTHASNITADNRDAYVHAARTEAAFYMVADGSTLHAHSGELARGLLQFLKESFIGLPPQAFCNADALNSSLIDLLSDARTTFRKQYPLAACSYLILVQLPDSALSIHEGDCCLGQLDNNGTITWLTPPHCLANWTHNIPHADIARDPLRHALTRCFSARRNPEPCLKQWPLKPNHYWLLATDGFWACLPNQAQLDFLSDHELSTDITDDISCLRVSP